jgi:hypothetical protein
MIDTPEYIYQKQYEIIAAKPLSERIRLGFETIDSTRKWIEHSIKHDSPGISPTDLAIAVFLRYYQYDFSETQLKEIIQSIRAYHANRSQTLG